MSKGSRVIPIRFPKHLEDAILQAMVSLDKHGKGEVLTFSQWVRRACERDLAHRERSNRRKQPQEVRCTACGQPYSGPRYYHDKAEAESSMQTLCPNCQRLAEGGINPP